MAVSPVGEVGLAALHGLLEDLGRHRLLDLTAAEAAMNPTITGASPCEYSAERYSRCRGTPP